MKTAGNTVSETVPSNRRLGGRSLRADHRVGEATGYWCNGNQHSTVLERR